MNIVKRVIYIIMDLASFKHVAVASLSDEIKDDATRYK